MPAKYFLDTNILVYCFEDGAPAKRKTAHDLVEKALREHSGMISYQVVQEFLNVALRKFKTPLKAADAKSYLDQVLLPLCEIYPGPDFYSRALDLHHTAGFSLYDALIFQAALEGECPILYSEDFQDGFKHKGVSVVNPFKPSQRGQ